MVIGGPEVLFFIVGFIGPLAALGFVVYWAVKAAVRNAARGAVDEVVVRLLDYGWQPPGGLTPEATEIRRQDRADRA